MKAIWKRKIGQGVIDVAVDRARRRIFAGDVNGVAKGFDYNGLECFHAKVDMPIWGIDVNERDESVAIGMASKNPSAGGVAIISSSGKRQKWNCSSPVWDVKFELMGDGLYASTWANGLVLLGNQAAIRKVIPSDVALFGLCMEHDNSLSVTGAGLGSGIVIDSSEQIEWIASGAGDACYKHLRVANRLFIGSSSDILYDYNIETNKLRQLRLPLRQICGLGSLGTLLCVGDLEGNLIISKLSFPEAPLHYERTEGAIWSIASDESAGLIFIASGDGTLRCLSIDERSLRIDNQALLNNSTLVADVTGAKVFVSYASEDRDQVIALYEALKRAGTNPWMDCFDLLPGQNWKREIDRQMRKSDFVLFCLSKRSVKKTGFVQRELRDALQLLLNMPEENIFLLPVRLDDCSIPDLLAERHCVSLGTGDGFIKLLKAIATEMERRQSDNL